MKTEYKYIYFEQDEVANEWTCHNKKSKDLLGYVSYYRQWKQWVIEFIEDCVFNTTCLNDISHFLSQLNSANSADSAVKG